MKLFIVLILSIFCLNQNLYSQKEAWNWYWGAHNGMSIIPNGTNPQKIANPNSSICLSDYTGYGQIGGATGLFSDKNGNILFYTNGLNVYDKL